MADAGNVNTQIQGDWMPLGVFSAGKTSTEAAYSDMIMQLALKKDGTISGTYYNSTTDIAKPIDGLVDKQTQQAAWTVTDMPGSPFMTTGMFNLTQEVVPVQVHFENGNMQNWVLVRLSDQQ